VVALDFRSGRLSPTESIMALRQIINLPMSYAAYAGVKITGDSPVYLHEETGLLLLEVTDTAAGLKVCTRNRSIIALIPDDVNKHTYSFVAGVSYLDGLRAYPIAKPSDFLPYLFDTNTGATKARDFRSPAAVRDVLISNSGLVGLTPGGEYGNSGGIMCYQNAIYTRAPTSPLLAAFSGTMRYFTFLHGWYAGAGCSALTAVDISRAYTANYRPQLGAARSGGKWADTLSSTSRITPANHAVVLCPTGYTIGSAIKRLLTGADYAAKIEGRVRSILTSLGVSNLDSTTLLEPAMLAWKLSSLSPLTFEAYNIDPMAQPTTANLAGDGNRAHNECFDMIVGAKFALNSSFSVTMPYPILDGLKYPVGGGQDTDYWVSTIGNDRARPHVAHKPLVELIDGVPAAQVFGMQPFMAFYTLSTNNWSDKAPRVLPTGDYKVGNNLAARAGVGRGDDALLAGTFGLDGSGVQTSAKTTSDFAALMAGGDRALSAGKSQLDGYCLTARTLVRVINDCVGTGLGEVYFNDDLARAILTGTESAAVPTVVKQTITL